MNLVEDLGSKDIGIQANMSVCLFGAIFALKNLEVTATEHRLASSKPKHKDTRVFCL